MTAESRDFEQDKLRQFESWAVYLHEDQTYLGRTYIALERGGDQEEMDPFLDTTTVEKEELTTIAQGLKLALDELYQPTRLNYSNLRNHWHKCHWHVVPRYEGEDQGHRVVDGFSFYDLNPGKHYAPSLKIDVPENVFVTIKTDLTQALDRNF